MLYAVVLAGGRSSRMGRDKALLAAGGQTLLERARALLERTGADRIYISGRAGGDDAINDLLPHCGPPGGLYSTLHTIKGEYEYGLDGSPLLVIPVDMPLLDKPMLRRLLDALGDAQAARYSGEIFPCVFRATRGLYTHLAALFSESTELGGDRSMKGLFASRDTREIGREDIPETCFININRPEDWDCYVRYYL